MTLTTGIKLKKFSLSFLILLNVRNFTMTVKNHTLRRKQIKIHQMTLMILKKMTVALCNKSENVIVHNIYLVECQK